MPLLEFADKDSLGRVRSVDTATVVIQVANVEQLRRMQVNRLVALQSSKAGQHLIGIVEKITRSSSEPSVSTSIDPDAKEQTLPEVENLVRVVLIGTHIDREGDEKEIFRRTLETVPEIDANCFALEGDHLTGFMRAISKVSGDGHRLSLGNYTLDERAEAILNGNKFFQRHAIIVGSTGSGKSWTTARLLEQVAALPNANAIVFDIHGEYEPLKGDGFRHFRVAGPSELDTKKGLSDGILYLPYWLLGYEAMISMFVDRSDQNAPNQAMVIARTVVEQKRKYLETKKQPDILNNFTVDSPVPFSLDAVMKTLEELNKEMVPGAKAGTEKQGELHGRLSRLISRLEAKRTDRRLGFLFRESEETGNFEFLEAMSNALVAGGSDQTDGKGGVKIIDFSEVPSDVLPLIVSLVARLAFSVQQWSVSAKRHPVALLCDEAHLYIPERANREAADDISVGIFERIAKEGRKYGVGLVVISQRPSEVNRTVLSQCNNLVSMRLTNADDQNVVKRLLPDSLGGFSELLPILDTGEALVVGDASLLPSRIRIKKPATPPNSGTVDFWDHWATKKGVGGTGEAVRNWRRQSMPN